MPVFLFKLGFYLFPGHAGLRMPTMLLQPAVQFVSLGGRKLRLVAFGFNVFPQSLGKFNPLRQRQSFGGLK